MNSLDKIRWKSCLSLKVISGYVQNDWPVVANDVRCDCFFASHITSGINFCFYFTSAFFSCFSSPIGTCIGRTGDGTRGLSEQIWMAQTEE